MRCVVTTHLSRRRGLMHLRMQPMPPGHRAGQASSCPSLTPVALGLQMPNPLSQHMRELLEHPSQSQASFPRLLFPCCVCLRPRGDEMDGEGTPGVGPPGPPVCSLRFSLSLAGRPLSSQLLQMGGTPHLEDEHGLCSTGESSSPWMEGSGRYPRRVRGQARRLYPLCHMVEVGTEPHPSRFS